MIIILRDTMTFIKGKSGNPKGRPKGSESPQTTIRNFETLKELSKGFVEIKIAAAMQRTIQELIEVYKNPNSQSIDVAISSIMINSAKGDYRALNFLFDRVIGRVTEKIDMNLPEPFVLKSLDGKTETKLGMKQQKKE